MTSIWWLATDLATRLTYVMERHRCRSGRYRKALHASVLPGGPGQERRIKLSQVPVYLRRHAYEALQP